MSELDRRIAAIDDMLESGDANRQAHEVERSKYKFLEHLQADYNGNGLHFCGWLMSDHLYPKLHPSRLPATEYRCVHTGGDRVETKTVLYEVLERLFDDGLWNYLKVSDAQFPMNWNKEFEAVLKAKNVDQQLAMLDKIADNFCMHFRSLANRSFADFVADRVDADENYLLPA